MATRHGSHNGARRQTHAARGLIDDRVFDPSPRGQPRGPKATRGGHGGLLPEGVTRRMWDKERSRERELRAWSVAAVLLLSNAVLAAAIAYLATTSRIERAFVAVDADLELRAPSPGDLEASEALERRLAERFAASWVEDLRRITLDPEQRARQIERLSRHTTVAASGAVSAMLEDDDQVIDEAYASGRRITRGVEGASVTRVGERTYLVEYTESVRIGRADPVRDVFWARLVLVHNPHLNLADLAADPLGLAVDDATIELKDHAKRRSTP